MSTWGRLGGWIYVASGGAPRYAAPQETPTVPPIPQLPVTPPQPPLSVYGNSRCPWEVQGPRGKGCS
ncbi:hypothetical protein E2C01_057754 [Portunus trituberculatus]|uniref:Uncharacterized protein n=1 Tax=Portunus trituberculatus TaxID=210409 RepID=A0A5B7H0V4_PORTR|nr:hypothetical protein [Portunus trituberculatus]